MNTEIVKTDYFREKRVDVVVIDGVEYFVVDQIARALGYSEVRTLYQRVNKLKFKKSELIKVFKNDIGQPTMTDVDLNPKYSYYYFVNEYGLNRILIHSRAKLAEDFQEWLIYEVLPSIRKKGYYVSERADLDKMRLEVEKLKYEAEIEKAKNRKADIFIEYSRNYPKQISEESQQALHAQALITISPESADIVKLSLPSIEKEYTATDIKNILWREYKIEKTALEIGKVAKILNIKNDPELCRIVPLVLQGKDGTVSEKMQYKYKETAKDMIVNYYIKSMVALNNF